MKNKHGSGWPLLFSMTLIVLFASYYLYSRSVYPADKDIYIVSYGIICTAAILFLALYTLRKRTYRYRLGSREGWLQAHVYIGIIAVVMMFMHISFKPAGTFGIFLSILFFLVVISGVAGSLIYAYVPLSLSKYGGALLSEEEISSSIYNYLEEADHLINGASEELKGLYRSKIRQFFKQGTIHWKYLLMTEGELLDKRMELIETCRAVVPGQDMHDLEILSTILMKKEKLSFTQAKLKIQKAWLTFHMPLTLALLTASVIHILTVLYY
jgi:hypothetical protein